jgi:hypothetical protein
LDSTSLLMGRWPDLTTPHSQINAVDRKDSPAKSLAESVAPLAAARENFRRDYCSHFCSQPNGLNSTQWKR